MGEDVYEQIKKRKGFARFTGKHSTGQIYAGSKPSAIIWL